MELLHHLFIQRAVADGICQAQAGPSDWRGHGGAELEVLVTPPILGQQVRRLEAESKPHGPKLLVT